MCVCACLFFFVCFFYVINLSLGGYTLLTHITHYIPVMFKYLFYPDYTF